MKDTVIQTRIDSKLKGNAEKVFSALGFSLNDGIRMFLNQVAIDKGLPFRPSLRSRPNAETRRIIAETDAGINVKTFKTKEDLFKDLEI